MDAAAGRTGGKSWLDVWVGIEVGVLGALLMLIWFAVISPIIGQPWWLIPNLFASQLYSDYQMRSGAGAVTWVGSALHIIASGVVGAINGVLTPGGRLFCLGVAIFWYLLCYLYLWKRIAPLLPLYAPQPILIAAWFLFGSTLGWHPWFAARAKSTSEGTR